MYDGHFWGMHWIWWILWIVFIIWIFVTPWGFYRQRTTRKETPLEILKRRYAEGKISTEEYEERKKRLEREE
jgi:putative membrane protein